MPKLLFFSRVAFVCNICFLVTLGMHYAEQLKSGFMISTIIIIGLVLSIVINLMINIAYLLVGVARRNLTTHVPAWLIVINFLFFLLQAILLVK
jgi:hypothetical protein